MKKLLAVALALLSSVASADQPSWTLVNVTDETKQNVGYIYQMYATGTKYTTPVEKQPTALRLICSTADNSPPILAIYWNRDDGSNNNQQLKITVDRQPFVQDWSWIQEGTLTYRSLQQSNSLVDKMKSAHILSAEWNDNAGVRHLTMFNLNGFAVHYGDFLAACKL